MGEKRGCFKTGLFGCLGLLAIVVLFVGVTALVAWKNSGKRDIQDRQLDPVGEVLDLTAATEQASGEAPETDLGELPAVPHPGRLVLNVSQGDFRIHPSDPGTGVRVKAKFDTSIYELTESYETLPDSSWIYTVNFHRTIGGMQALFRELMSGGVQADLRVFIPPDIPLDLDLHVEEGGLDVELGGLWITSSRFRFNKGGFSLSFDQPLVEPMENMIVLGKMGGFEASRLGNASPGTLDVKCSMGGADIDLRGQWMQDSEIRAGVTMGGMSLRAPRDALLVGPADLGLAADPGEVENPLPVLKLSIYEKMGEVEVVH